MTRKNTFRSLFSQLDGVQWLSFALLLIVAFKPLIDFLWLIRISVLKTSINLQGLVAGLIIVCAIAFLSRDFLRGEKKFPQLSFFATLLIGAFAILRGSSKDFVLKYLASASGVFLLPIAWAQLQNLRSLRRWILVITVISIGMVLISCLFQLMDWFPYLTYDTQSIEVAGFGTLFSFGRLSGFYSHPLDLVRVLIWPFLFLLIHFFQSHWMGSALPLLALEFLFYKTSHRITLVCSLIATALMGIYSGKWVRAGVLILSVFAVWSLAADFFSKKEGISQKEIVSLNSAVGWDYTLSQKENPKKQAAPVFHLRGRSIWWKEHTQWISQFNLREISFGTIRPYPSDREAEPHQQFLDWIERFGIIGCLIFAIQGFGGILTLPTTGASRLLILSVLGIFSMMTEAWVMPTFIWWACGFALINRPSQ